MRELTRAELEAVSGGGSLVDLIVAVATSGGGGREFGEAVADAFRN